MLKKIILNKFLAGILIVPLLKLHNFLYKLISSYATLNDNGIHPKHDILKYKEWFSENISDNSTVIDIGCNIGSLPYVLAKKANQVYGIEIVEKHIQKAKKHNQKDNIEYICADATSYDYSKIKPIDCITLSNVLEHIESRVDFLKKIIEKVHWKNDDKTVLIRVPMINRDWITLYKKRMSVEYRLDLTHYTEYTYEDFYHEIQEAGLNIYKYDIRFGEIYAICKVKNEVL